ncbi:MAG TPA: MIP/aquaporin family protein [Cryobacterium sp.]|jgi:glycerol uptake facilitator protein|nr:MIP/aquaporin family protein [Cryobacterium sp.]
MQYGLVRRLVAEAVGTAILVLFGAGSVIAALTIGKGHLDFAGVGFIALAFAIAIAVAVYGFLPVSGAHINPAVTFALAVTRRFPWVEVVPYFVAQLIGGAVGGLLIVAAFGTKAIDLGAGATTLGAGVSYGQGIVAEALGTFLLMFAVMATAVDGRMPAGWAGLIVGLAVSAAIMVMLPLTGGSLNPARTFGPDLALALFGGTVHWGQFLLYWIGPLIGAAVAALLYDLVARPRAAAALQCAEDEPPREAPQVKLPAKR